MSVYWRCLVFLLLLAALHKVTNAQKNTKILSMPGIKDNANIVNVSQWMNNLNYTFCMWLKIDSNISFDDYPIAYIQSNSLLIVVYVQWDYENNRITIGAGSYREFFSYCPPRSWFHSCAVFVPDGPDRLYVNGNPIDLSRDSFYKGNLYKDFFRKIFVLLIGGEKGFKGMLYNLNIWNSLLTDQQISDLANCKSKAEGNQISWTQVTQNIELDKAEFITGTGPCTTPITRQNMKLLNVDEDYNIEPVNCTASSSSLPEDSSEPSGSFSDTDGSSQPSSGSSSDLDSSSQPSSGSSSTSTGPDGSSQPSSGSSSTSTGPNGSSQPSSGSSSTSAGPNGSSQPSSGSSST